MNRVVICKKCGEVTNEEEYYKEEKYFKKSKECEKCHLVDLLSLIHI